MTLVVQKSDEFYRIFALTRRELNGSVDLTEEFRRKGGTARLWPIQSAALHEARMQGGLFAPIGVGFGNTLISLLVMKAMGYSRAVYLVPAQLKTQLRNVDYPFWNKHFILPALDRELFILTYEDLSSAKRAHMLEALKPQLVIADECHKLRYKNSARTKRFLRYMRSSGADAVLLSGTITTRSLMDYGHLIELALRNYSPLPNSERAWNDLKEWSEAIDAPVRGQIPRSPGALLSFCNDDELSKITDKVFESQKYVRAGFRRRLIETPGVVATEEGALGTSLVLSARDFELPGAVEQQLFETRRTWKIDDEEIEEAPHMWSVMRQLSLGFYYVWDWPRGEKNFAWLQARAQWHQAVREFLRYRSRPGLDSPFLLTAAIERGEIGDELTSLWRAWKFQRQKLPQPPRKPVRLS